MIRTQPLYIQTARFEHALVLSRGLCRCISHEIVLELRVRHQELQQCCRGQFHTFRSSYAETSMLRLTSRPPFVTGINCTICQETAVLGVVGYTRLGAPPLKLVYYV